MFVSLTEISPMNTVTLLFRALLSNPITKWL